jgi:hypothetical protein
MGGTWQEDDGMNACGSCGLDFGSLRAFDSHRVGKHAYDQSDALRDERRCFTADEMRRAGFAQNSRERWSLQRDLVRASERHPIEPRSSETAS